MNGGTKGVVEENKVGNCNELDAISSSNEQEQWELNGKRAFRIVGRSNQQ